MHCRQSTMRWRRPLGFQQSRNGPHAKERVPVPVLFRNRTRSQISGLPRAAWRPPDDARLSLKGPQEQGASDCNCQVISTRRHVGLRIVEGCADARRGGRWPGPQSPNCRSVHLHPKFPSRQRRWRSSGGGLFKERCKASPAKIKW